MPRNQAHQRAEANSSHDPPESYRGTHDAPNHAGTNTDDPRPPAHPGHDSPKNPPNPHATPSQHAHPYPHTTNPPVGHHAKNADPKHQRTPQTPHDEPQNHHPSAHAECSYQSPKNSSHAEQYPPQPAQSKNHGNQPPEPAPDTNATTPSDPGHPYARQPSYSQP